MQKTSPKPKPIAKVDTHRLETKLYAELNQARPPLRCPTFFCATSGVWKSGPKLEKQDTVGSTNSDIGEIEQRPSTRNP